MSLQIKRCQPLTRPSFVENIETRFLPEVGMQGPSIAEYSQKMHVATTPMARSKTKARPSFPAHSAGRKNPPPHEVPSGGSFMGPRSRRKGRLRLSRQLRQLTRRCKPSCSAVPRQHQTGCRSESRGLLHHGTDLGVASREGHGLVGAIDLVVNLAHRGDDGSGAAQAALPQRCRP